MKKTKIYVVIGTTGNYSDMDEWMVIAYFSKVKAKNHAKKAELRAKEYEIEIRGRYFDPIPKGYSKYDPNMKMDYTGTTYFVSEVELVGEK